MIDKNIARKYAERWEFWSRSWCKAASSDGECQAGDCPQAKGRNLLLFGHRLLDACPRPWLRDLTDNDHVPDPLNDDERRALFSFVRSQIGQYNESDGMSVYCDIVNLAIYLGLPSDTVSRRLVDEASRWLSSNSNIV